MRIAIVGGGYAGATVATALLNELPSGHSITIYEPYDELGRGLAYARGSDRHLLNVPAHTLSLHPDNEEHFSQWALARFPDAGTYREADGSYFFPRWWFGTYVGEMLQEAMRRQPGITTEHVPEAAQSIEIVDGSLNVTSAGGSRSFDKLVLCIGNAPPRPLDVLEPPGVRPRIVQSAWSFDAGQVGKDDRVIVVGSGLTMADVVATLEEQGHQGTITCVSRHGRMPHVAIGVRPEFTPAAELPNVQTARALVQRARQLVHEATAELMDWRPAIDHLRRSGVGIWRALSPAERARLRRHARSLWEIHRYMMPPVAHRRIAALKDAGRFTHVRAEVMGIVPGGVRVKAKGAIVDLPADVVVNASGFDTSYGTAPAPLAALLEATGTAPAEARRLGIAIDDNGRVLGAPAGFYAAGFLARANHGDLATVNTIRLVADSIAADIRAGA